MPKLIANLVDRYRERIEFSSKAPKMLELAMVLWPNVTFYAKQKEIFESVEENDETVVPAGNTLGKDFVAGAIVLAFFLTRHPCRIVTTSVKDDHLRVLWGEIGNRIQSSFKPLTVSKGGPIIQLHRELRKVVSGSECPLSYVRGMVAAEGAAMQGHYVADVDDGIPRTLFVVDEASGVPDAYYDMASSWANRILIIGNPLPCNNFFFRAVEGGARNYD
jgi:hypothetical protein